MKTIITEAEVNITHLKERGPEAYVNLLPLPRTEVITLLALMTKDPNLFKNVEVVRITIEKVR